MIGKLLSLQVEPSWKETAERERERWGRGGREREREKGREGERGRERIKSAQHAYLDVSGRYMYMVQNLTIQTLDLL